MYLCNIVNGKRVKMPDTLQVRTPFFFHVQLLMLSQLVDVITSSTWIVFYSVLGFHTLTFCICSPLKRVIWTGLGRTCEASGIKNLFLCPHGYSNAILDEPNLAIKKYSLSGKWQDVWFVFLWTIPFATWFLAWSKLPKHYLTGFDYMHLIFTLGWR